MSNILGKSETKSLDKSKTKNLSAEEIADIIIDEFEG